MVCCLIVVCCHNVDLILSHSGLNVVILLHRHRTKLPSSLIYTWSLNLIKYAVSPANKTTYFANHSRKYIQSQKSRTDDFLLHTHSPNHLIHNDTPTKWLIVIPIHWSFNCGLWVLYFAVIVVVAITFFVVVLLKNTVQNWVGELEFGIACKRYLCCLSYLKLVLKLQTQPKYLSTVLLG